MTNTKFFAEISALANGLMARGIDFKFRTLFEGYQIICDGWDAVCHEFSYGGKNGLIEIMGDIVKVEGDDVEGYLTAETILNRIDELSL